MKIIISFSVLAVLLVFTQTAVLSHGTGGSYEEEKDGYIVDIGYSEVSPEAGSPIRFDFFTYPEDDAESAEKEIFTDVWVRVTESGNQRNLFFSGGINKPVFGATGFSYMFPKEGIYEIFVRFQKEGETVVETSFDLEVSPSTKEDKDETISVHLLVAGGGGVILGVLLMLFIPRKTIT